MKSFFPASYSMLASDALSSLIAEKYKFKNVFTRLVVRWVGDTYLVESSTTNLFTESTVLRIARWLVDVLINRVLIPGTPARIISGTGLLSMTGR